MQNERICQTVRIDHCMVERKAAELRSQGYTDDEIEVYQAGGHMDVRVFHPRGIHVTSVVPPVEGWPMAMHCPICKCTRFSLCIWATPRVTAGGYLLLEGFCDAVPEHRRLTR